MSKQRDMNDKDFLETLIKLREDKFSKNDFIKKQINVKKCRPLGLFSYRVKESGENKEGRLFLLSEIHDGNEYDIIYNQKDKDLIYEDLSNIIKIAIDTKDFFKHIYYDQKQKIVLEEVKSDEANRIFEELTECIARGAFLKSILLK